ncbi:MAG: cobyric acid synthase [Pseudomonadota bacterium]|nr:cobyric acid synthase [Pseudomonadota bacterium]MDE3038782.1 cobyric acid synthase [Pseudomonadota bacterium]
MSARTLMFQGTGSDVGKSLVVAGLCRLFARQGLHVVPFKAQNMSNNAAVTPDGGEIGRAQWLQALASGIVPSVHMNPVLLKPQSDRSSQVIVRGKVAATMSAKDYQAYRPTLMPTVLESYHYLAKNADMVLVEGAGSPAEINLRHGDIANMGFARAVGCPVILIGDIDRGGVIASLAGTHMVLPPEDRAMIRGFLINKFRGDAGLFADGAGEIERYTGWPYLGLIPYNHALSQLPQEDSLALNNSLPPCGGGLGRGGTINVLTRGEFPTTPPFPTRGEGEESIHIAILSYPHIANFDDLDPLKNEPGVRLSWCRAGDVLPADASLVILPGSKSTIADLAFIRAQGWDIDLQAHRRRGGRILGICGGFQMLGKTLSDPDGVEDAVATVEGLGLLDIDTVFTSDKTVTPWQGKYSDIEVTGYEIHCGISKGEALARPFFTSEGARSNDDLVWGTYIHGLFATDNFRRSLLARLGAKPSSYAYGQHMQQILDGWADMLEDAVSIKQLMSLAMPVPA